MLQFVSVVLSPFTVCLWKKVYIHLLYNLIRMLEIPVRSTSQPSLSYPRPNNWSTQHLLYILCIFCSKFSFPTWPSFSPADALQWAWQCGTSPVGVLLALWDTEARWERKLKYKAWLCFQMFEMSDPSGRLATLQGWDFLDNCWCQLHLGRKQSRAVAELISFPSLFTSFSSAGGRQFFTRMCICQAAKKDMGLGDRKPWSFL